MRRIMVDHARERQALKRGGGTIRVSLDEAAAVTQTRADELLALDEAMEGLANFDPRKARVVELRHFGGLTTEEIAEVLKINVNTVTRDWERKVVLKLLPRLLAANDESCRACSARHGRLRL